MARGFESKSVTDQQESAFEKRGPRGDPAPPPQRRKLELARADVLNRIEAAAGNDRYLAVLKSTLAALDKELSGLR
jgi:hypothetical protein